MKEWNELIGEEETDSVKEDYDVIGRVLVTYYRYMINLNSGLESDLKTLSQKIISKWISRSDLRNKLYEQWILPMINGKLSKSLYKDLFNDQKLKILQELIKKGQPTITTENDNDTTEYDNSFDAYFSILDVINFLGKVPDMILKEFNSKDVFQDLLIAKPYHNPRDILPSSLEVDSEQTQEETQESTEEFVELNSDADQDLIEDID